MKKQLPLDETPSPAEWQMLDHFDSIGRFPCHGTQDLQLTSIPALLSSCQSRKHVKRDQNLNIEQGKSKLCIFERSESLTLSHYFSILVMKSAGEKVDYPLHQCFVAKIVEFGLRKIEAKVSDSIHPFSLLRALSEGRVI